MSACFYGRERLQRNNTKLLTERNRRYAMKLYNCLFKSDGFQSLHKALGIVIALVFSIWGMILRFKAFANRDLWVDEMIQIKMTLEPLKPLWLRENSALDVTSFPGDYLLTYPFVKLFGTTSKLIAIPHAIVTLLGFYILVKDSSNLIVRIETSIKRTSHLIH